MRRSVVLLIVVALVAASSVTTWVVAGAATKGKISGCVDDRTGEIDQMRFGKRPKGGECDEGETAFTWNVRGRRGPAGPEGPQGPQGPAGSSGPAGPLAPMYKESTTSPVLLPGVTSTVEVACDSGDIAFGGGWSSIAAVGEDYWAIADQVITDFSTYRVRVHNGTAGALTFGANVYCFDFPPLHP
jgi:hypothetical protein